MGYPTASTLWPNAQPSDEIRQLIDRFFIQADTKSDDVGERLAQEIFSPEGQFLSPNGTFIGSAEIRNSRKNAWTTVTSRHHVVSKVYINDTRSTDLILIGHFTTETVDGKGASMYFVARMLVEMKEQGPRIRQYRVISPPAKDERGLSENL